MNWKFNHLCRNRHLKALHKLIENCNIFQQVFFDLLLKSYINEAFMIFFSFHHFANSSLLYNLIFLYIISMDDSKQICEKDEIKETI